MNRQCPKDGAALEFNIILFLRNILQSREKIFQTLYLSKYHDLQK